MTMFGCNNKTNVFISPVAQYLHIKSIHINQRIDHCQWELQIHTRPLGLPSTDIHLIYSPPSAYVIASTKIITVGLGTMENTLVDVPPAESQ